MAKNAREAALRRLLELELPLDRVVAELAVFPWNSDADLISLQAQHVRSVLRRHLDGELSSEVVEKWANAVECREDIGVVEGSGLRDVLHELANPLLTQPLTSERVQLLLARLSQSPGK